MDEDVFRVARVIRELEGSSGSHDYYDVVYDGVMDVLGRYGIFVELCEEEQKLLEDYLLDSALDDEVREIVHIVEECSDPVMDSIPERALPSLRLLQLEHKVWKGEMRKKRSYLDGL